MLEAQVPVQAAGVVLLDDEARRRLGAGRSAGRGVGLGGDGEVAPGAVAGELVVGHVGSRRDCRWLATVREDVGEMREPVEVIAGGYSRAVLIATWNVNSLRARLPRVLEFLELHAPAVVCLQETKCAPDTFPVGELAAAGYASAHVSAGQWAGVALLAREELGLTGVTGSLPGDPVPAEARWCEATIAGIRFASTYVPNGRTLDSPEFPRKLAFLDAMAQRARAQIVTGGVPFVIAGDLNIAPADADVYDPAAFAGSTHVTPAERTRLDEVLRGGQLVDAFRRLHPDTQQFTWWDYRAGHFHKGLGLRIDLVLLSESLAERAVACGIDRNFRKGNKPSDHAPLLVELR